MAMQAVHNPLFFAPMEAPMEGLQQQVGFVDHRETMISVLATQLDTLQTELANASQATQAQRTEMEKTISEQFAVITQLQIALAQKEAAANQMQAGAEALRRSLQQVTEEKQALQSKLQHITTTVHTQAETIVTKNQEIYTSLQGKIRDFQGRDYSHAGKHRNKYLIRSQQDASFLQSLSNKSQELVTLSSTLKDI